MNKERERLYNIFLDVKELLEDIRNALSGISPFPTEEMLARTQRTIRPENWVEVSSEYDVTVNPNETKTVLRVVDSGYLWEVGVNDETYTVYYLYVDDVLVGKPQYQPWGLYNSPYRFPAPIEFGRSVEIKVYRDKDAASPADYYAKVRYEKV